MVETKHHEVHRMLLLIAVISQVIFMTNHGSTFILASYMIFHFFMVLFLPVCCYNLVWQLGAVSVFENILELRSDCLRGKGNRL